MLQSILVKPIMLTFFGVAPVDVHPEDITSNRAETCTVLALAVLSTAIAQFFSIKSASLSIFCDNEEVLRHSSYKGLTYSKYTKRDMDLKLAIRKVLKDSSFSIQFCKVEGHMKMINQISTKSWPHNL